MSHFRGSFFRQSQTDYCASIPDPPQKGFDQHNPPGSMFREEQTLHVYGTMRFRRIEPSSEAVSTPEPSAPLPPHPAPQIETPEEAPSAETYQSSEMLSFDLSQMTSRRLLMMGAIRMIDRATQLGDGDGISPQVLRGYSKNANKSLARFDRTIKPKSPLAFLREKLFDD